MRHPLVRLKLALACLAAGGCLLPFFLNSAGGPARAASRPAAAEFTPRLPRGIPPRLWLSYVPADNPVTEAKVELGRALYFDRRLSADGTVSCATCHDPASAFADHEQRAVGVNGLRGARNAPTILNAMFYGALAWDGRARSLEDQAKLPLVNPDEMGMPSHDAVVAAVAAVPAYRRDFRRAFGGEGINIDTIVKAIAAFERTQLSGDSPFDRFAAGDDGALGEAQKRGWQLFGGKARCINCHAFSPASPFFTDSRFHNTGVAAKGGELDRLAAGRLAAGRRPAAPALGRYAVTGRDVDIGAFRTPTLRDVELTAPYMHDGSEATLLDVVKFYNRGGAVNAHLDRDMTPLGLTNQEMSDLVEFMRALTGDEVLNRARSLTPQPRAGQRASSGEQPETSRTSRTSRPRVLMKTGVRKIVGRPTSNARDAGRRVR